MTAVTIKGTTYEKFLNNLKNQFKLNFKTKYINSDENILDAISQKENRFGFIDLPIYLMLIKNGGNLTRQNFFTIKGNGYAFICLKKATGLMFLMTFYKTQKLKQK